MWIETDYQTTQFKKVYNQKKIYTLPLKRFESDCFLNKSLILKVIMKVAFNIGKLHYELKKLFLF